MTHLYDTIEPNVISESLLRECVVEQGPQGEAGRVANAEGIDFCEVLELRLERAPAATSNCSRSSCY